MMSARKTRFSSPNFFFLVTLIANGLLAQCHARQILRPCIPDSLVSNIEKESASRVNPSKVLIGAQPDTQGKEMVHVKRSFSMELHQPKFMADEFFDSIHESSRAWLKPDYEASWDENKFPKRLMLKYGDLATSGKTKHQLFTLSDVNVENWKKIPVVPLEIQPAMRNWFGANMVVEEASAFTAFDKIEWSARRAQSQQQVWWSQVQINDWVQKTSNWQSIIEVGDILRFDEKDLNFSFLEIEPIKTQLHNRMHQFQALEAWHTDLSKNWGRAQVCEALRDATGSMSNAKESLYDVRIEKILGALNPETHLGNLAAKIKFDEPIEGLKELELHWLMSGMNIAHAKTLGYAIDIARRHPSLNKKELTPSERNCIMALQQLISIPSGIVDSTTVIYGERWYKDALGNENSTGIRNAARLFKSVMNIEDTRPFYKRIFSHSSSGR